MYGGRLCLRLVWGGSSRDFTCSGRSVVKLGRTPSGSMTKLCGDRDRCCRESFDILVRDYIDWLTDWLDITYRFLEMFTFAHFHWLTCWITSLFISKILVGSTDFLHWLTLHSRYTLHYTFHFTTFFLYWLTRYLDSYVRDREALWKKMFSKLSCRSKFQCTIHLTLKKVLSKYLKSDVRNREGQTGHLTLPIFPTSHMVGPKRRPNNHPSPK